MHKMIFIGAGGVMLIALGFLIVDMQTQKQAEQDALINQYDVLPAVVDDDPTAQLIDIPDPHETVQPDPLQIAAYERSGDIWKISYSDEGKNPVQLTEYGFNRQPVLSPSGREILFLSLDDEVRQSSQRPQDAASDPTLDNYNLWFIDHNGENASRIFQRSDARRLASHAKWSPNGSAFAFLVRDTRQPNQQERLLNLMIYSADGTRLQQISSAQLQNVPASPTSFVWSPDGSQIAVFGRSADSPFYGLRSPVWTDTLVFNVASGSLTQQTTGRAGLFFPRGWSAADDTLYVVNQTNELGDYAIFQTQIGEQSLNYVAGESYDFYHEGIKVAPTVDPESPLNQAVGNGSVVFSSDGRYAAVRRTFDHDDGDAVFWLVDISNASAEVISYDPQQLPYENLRDHWFSASGDALIVRVQNSEMDQLFAIRLGDDNETILLDEWERGQ